jgi:hypothetical protein
MRLAQSAPVPGDALSRVRQVPMASRCALPTA